MAEHYDIPPYGDTRWCEVREDTQVVTGQGEA